MVRYQLHYFNERFELVSYSDFVQLNSINISSELSFALFQSSPLSC